MRHIPNIITVGRITCIPWLVFALLAEDFRVALYLMVLMGASDALDGFLAKHCHWQSRLGEILDPIADKLMLVSAYVIFGLQGLLPVWLVALVVARDALLFGGCIYYRYLNTDFDISPSMASKANTFCQTLLGFTVLIDQLGVELSALVLVLAAVVTVTTLLSGADYARTARMRILRRSVSRAG